MLIKHSSLLPLLFIAAPAAAFDQSGALAFQLLLLGLGGVTALNLLVQLGFWASGFYRSKRFTRVHLYASLVPILLGVAIVVWDHRGGADLLLDLGMLLVALAFALLPSLLSQQPGPAKPWLSALLSVLLLLLGSVLGPVAAVAILVAHIALPRQTGVGKYLCLLVLCFGYPLLGYYLYQLAGKLW